MSRSLDDLNPQFRPMVDAFLAAAQAADIDVLVTCTLRSLDEQEQLYERGRTAPGRIVTMAKPGQSAHNFGLAIDIVPIVDGKPQWMMSTTWETLGEMGEQAGMQWYGAPGSQFYELAHFQHPNWKLIAQQQET
jgi:peptidoglycan L-alanyl-D-glutamate endopeptidase CwlK